jgi:hypothetical protein
MLDRSPNENEVREVSRKPQTDTRFHDASDPRCTGHARAKKAGQKTRTDRSCPKCLAERGFDAVGVPRKPQ